MAAIGAIGLTYGSDPDWQLLLGGRNPWTGCAAGFILGIALVIASIVLTDLFRWAQTMEAEIRRLFGGIGIGTAVVLALLSGVGEELLFRGWLQGRVFAGWGEWISLLVVSLIFGAVHWPPTPALRPWPLFAAAIGMVFGLEYVLTGGLAASIITHSVINGVNLWRICGRRDRGPAAPGPVSPGRSDEQTSEQPSAE